MKYPLFLGVLALLSVPFFVSAQTLTDAQSFETPVVQQIIQLLEQQISSLQQQNKQLEAQVASLQATTTEATAVDPNLGKYTSELAGDLSFIGIGNNCAVRPNGGCSTTVQDATTMAEYSISAGISVADAENDANIVAGLIPYYENMESTLEVTIESEGGVGSNVQTQATEEQQAKTMISDLENIRNILVLRN